eukprot:350077-Chlamydomonas_euryale.AAC.6
MAARSLYRCRLLLRGVAVAEQGDCWRGEGGRGQLPAPQQTPRQPAIAGASGERGARRREDVEEKPDEEDVPSRLACQKPTEGAPSYAFGQEGPAQGTGSCATTACARRMDGGQAREAFCLRNSTWAVGSVVWVRGRSRGRARALPAGCSHMHGGCGERVTSPPARNDGTTVRRVCSRRSGGSSRSFRRELSATAFPCAAESPYAACADRLFVRSGAFASVGALAKHSAVHRVAGYVCSVASTLPSPGHRSSRALSLSPLLSGACAARLRKRPRLSLMPKPRWHAS